MLAARRHPRTVLLALAGSAAIVAALLLVAKVPGGPELAAGANHATVSAEDSANGPVAMGNGNLIGGAQKHDKSANLRDIPPDPVRALEEDEEEGDEDGEGSDSGPNSPDTVVQSTLASPAMPGTSKNFDGIGFPGVACNCAPPDTNGEVGLTQYVQIVNEGYQVWDKSTGTSVLGPVGISTIWNGFGGVCQSNGDGDPVVLYDQLANRWLVSQFAGAGTPTDECIAISTTSDATGAYYRYDFHLGTNFFDYPHLSVWPDGYYMSDNVFNSTGTAFLGAQPFAFDRVRMLQGLSATFQTTAPMGSLSDAMLPADLDGSTLPPAGAPASFVSWPSTLTYRTYHYHVDWATPASSTWTLFASPAAAPFTALCQTSRACVPQLGSPSNLDGLADRPMFRLTYRNFGDHEAVVGNFTVSSGGVAGIRWFELRNVTNGPETVFQQSTYQPDTTWRWMGSAAMDKFGNIALGFSASSSAIHPELRYAGRLAGDPLNTLAQGEATLYAGAGSQTGTSNRWGDYADMTVDPVDDCTFWFTSEYYSTVSQFNWRTRIGSFSMPGCGGGGPTTGSIGGHVTSTIGGGAISGATVSISGGASTTTDATGAYSFTNLAPAGYSLTASKTGFTTSAPASVTVTAGNTSTKDFALVPTTGSISGHATSSSGGAAISGATVAVSGGPSTTTDAAGAFTISGLAPGSYSVTASKTGFASSTAPSVSVSAGVTTTQNFSLTPTTFTTARAYAGSSVAGTGGDGNGFQTSRSSLTGAPNGASASDPKSGTAGSLTCPSTARDSEVASGYSIGTVGSTILGIQVAVTGRANATSGSPRFCVQLSWNGGTNWTTGIAMTGNLTTTLATYTLGSTSSTWGRAWTAAELSSASFRVRIIDLASTTNRTFYLDAVGVNVTYQ